MEDEDLVPVPKPIYSDFIIDNGKGFDLPGGSYYHFTEVIRLIKLWEREKNIKNQLEMEKEKTKEPASTTIDTISKPLTFGELEAGECFVDFPTDGDDSGHGGFRGGAYVFKKMAKNQRLVGNFFNNAFRLTDGNKSHFPDTMQVYKVII